MGRKRICVVTGSRAEYGLLYWVLRDLEASEDVELQLVVTGMHLAPQFGHTVDAILDDGFRIARRIETLDGADTPAGVCAAIGRGVSGMSEALDDLRPDVVLVLGDRFEILAVVQACLIHGVPVAHIAGGDVTEGANDESMRHAITKMAHVHFVTNSVSGARVRQMGEDPSRVHVVGSPGLDHLHRLPLLDRVGLEEALQAPLGRRNVIVTFHPVTLSPSESMGQLHELLLALDALADDVVLWCTLPNADAGGRALGAVLSEWVRERSARARVYPSLGQLRYLSLLKHSDAMVGNSSSGLYEAPSFGVPAVNIGDRQKGRLMADSVFSVEPTRVEISRGLAAAFERGVRATVNPYGDGRSAGRIVGILRSLPPAEQLRVKRFHDEAFANA